MAAIWLEGDRNKVEICRSTITLFIETRVGFERVPRELSWNRKLAAAALDKGKMWRPQTSLIQVGASRTSAEPVKLLSITIIYFLIESHGKVW